ncbi:phosphoglycerate dehydrogenase [Terasakiella sp. A23]|uniref:phosphoglycerate dehydrogenase n=1 Tax=Terasakiella sp. FCG-A23 TaxID=3080561 RepID=UPI00295339A8|nr:phosphoglycerate dehydrogenase [Terasakiella sp. A23]MDV7340810.1 phosphoglycerate dehydrogenase [Terasakiella sp. A23]
MKAVITTVPFGAIDETPLVLMKEAGLDYEINPLGRKLKPEEVAGVIGSADIVIAGTERIDKAVMDQCPNLKAICRVGIGLDSVDLVAAKEKEILVSYTPDAPSPAVAELTIGLMLDVLRGVSKADRDIRQENWHRLAGRRLSDCKVGILGCGRIGARVIKHLAMGFPGVDIWANDLLDKPELDGFVTWADKKDILQQCDVISLHLPLTPQTQNLISAQELSLLKSDAVLINTARGGMINEKALADAIKNGQLHGAAIDVFEQEPYCGELAALDNLVLTCHLGSMTKDCRAQMEIEATAEAVRFMMKEQFLSPVPQAEYDMAESFAVKRGE